MLSLNQLPGAINELIANVGARYGLMAAILDETLSEEDRSSLDRLIRLLVQGKFLLGLLTCYQRAIAPTKNAKLRAFHLPNG